MKKLLLITALTLLSTFATGDFSCPDGANAACIDKGDTVCPATAKCVASDVVCLDKQSCGPGVGFICESDYDSVLAEQQNTVKQYDQLVEENTDLRDRRLQQKNCVMNADTLDKARACVR